MQNLFPTTLYLWTSYTVCVDGDEFDLVVTAESELASLTDTVRETLKRCVETAPLTERLVVRLAPLSALADHDHVVESKTRRKRVRQLFRERLSGVGGVTTTDGVWIYVDTTVHGHREALGNAVAHEYAHVCRDAGDGRLADRLVDEGLAQCFEAAMTDRQPPQTEWATVDDAERLLRAVADRLESRDRSLHGRVLYGSFGEDDTFVPGAGYVLAYELVAGCEITSDRPWPEAFTTPTHRVFETTRFPR